LAESVETSLLTPDDFSEMLEFLNANFRKYMHAREILNTLSPRTLRRYTKHLPKRPRLTKDENELEHRMVAAMHTYEINAISSSQGGAHFASGLFATAACEAIIIIRLIEVKSIVKDTGTFKRLWKKFREQPRKDNKAKTFSQFLLEQRVEVLIRLSKEVGIFDEGNLPERVAEVLKERGFEDRLSDFVRQSRNCIHPRWILQANERYAKIWDVSYSIEGMESFHADFALCAWELHGRLGNPQLTQTAR
jgi:DNA-binding transcriptional regulator/RsmH inhibitor MraZ